MKNILILSIFFVLHSCGPAGDPDNVVPKVLELQSYSPGSNNFEEIEGICRALQGKVGYSSSFYNTSSFADKRLYNYSTGACGESISFSGVIERFYRSEKFDVKLCDNNGNNCNNELRLDYLEDLYVSIHRFFKPFCDKVFSGNETENTLRNESGELLQITFNKSTNQASVNIGLLNEESDKLLSQYRFLFRLNKGENDDGYLLNLTKLSQCGNNNFETVQITLR